MGGGVRFSGAWVRIDVISSPELVVSPGIGEFEGLMDFFFFVQELVGFQTLEVSSDF